MTATFKDRTGEDFHLELTLADVMAIEAYDFQGQCAKVKLIPPDEKFFEERIGDPKMLFGIAWILVQRQIKGRKYKNPAYDPKVTDKEDIRGQEFVTINDELDFAYRFDGPTLEGLKKAVWHEITGFFPQAATTIRNLTERLEKLQEIGIRRGNKMISEKLTDDQLEKAWDEAEEMMMVKAASRGDGLTSSVSLP